MGWCRLESLSIRLIIYESLSVMQWLLLSIVVVHAHRVVLEKCGRIEVCERECHSYENRSILIKTELLRI